MLKTKSMINAMKQKSLMLLKPECYKWNIADDIKQLLESNGFYIESQKEVIVDMKIMQIFLMHYKDVIDRMGADFNFPGRLFNSYYFNGEHKICVMCVSNDKDLIHDSRKLIGATEPLNADKNTIRALFSNDSYEKANQEKRLLQNCIHASDSLESAEYELKLWKDYR